MGGTRSKRSETQVSKLLSFEPANINISAIYNSKVDDLNCLKTVNHNRSPELPSPFPVSPYPQTSVSATNNNRISASPQILKEKTRTQNMAPKKQSNFDIVIKTSLSRQPSLLSGPENPVLAARQPTLSPQRDDFTFKLKKHQIKIEVSFGCGIVGSLLKIAVKPIYVRHVSDSQCH